MAMLRAIRSAGTSRRVGIERGEVVEHRGIADGGVFDDLGEALAEFAVGQGAQGFADRRAPARGWWKAPSRFFPSRHVDAGLAADRGIDL